MNSGSYSATVTGKIGQLDGLTFTLGLSSNYALSTAVGLGAGVGIGGLVGTMTAKTLNPNTQDTSEIPPIPTINYYLAIKGQRQGPFGQEEIERKIINDEINENTLIWKKGLKQWVKTGEMDEFKHLFEEYCPPPIPNE